MARIKFGSRCTNSITGVTHDSVRYIDTGEDVTSDIADGPDTPNWRRTRSGGRLVVNPYRRSVINTFAQRSPVYWTSVGYPTVPKAGVDTWEMWETYSTFFAYFGIKHADPTPSKPTFSREALITKAIAMANKNEWDASVSLAEFGETVAMLAVLVKSARSPLKSLTQLFTREARRKFPKGSISERRLSLKQVFESGSTGWLTWRYGIRPLISDIQSASEFLARKHKIRWRAAVRPSGDDTRVVQTILRSEGRPRRPAMDFGVELRSEVLRGQAVVTSSYEYDSLSALMFEQLGFTAKDLPKIGWELIPFSFVLDWFVNVGQWIDTFTTPSGLTQRVGSYSEKTLVKTETKVQARSWTEGPTGGFTHWVLSTPSFTIPSSERMEFTRSVISTGSPQSPNWGSGLNAARSLDLATIFTLISGLLRK